MSKTNENSGAKAAFKGFRTQTIYILHRLLSQTTNQVFIPEGEEDLLIKENGKIVEVIQVKNYGVLNLSNFSPKKTDPFFNRSVRLLESGDTPIINVVSFGSLSNQLEDYRQTNKSENISEKLISKYNLTKKQVKLLFKYWRIESVKEEELIKAIKAKLTLEVVAMNWQVAFDLLMYWLYVISEEKRSITKDDLIQKLQSIGLFISERYAFLTQYGTSIRDIAKDNQNIEQQYLKNEFYNGAGAKYAHIKANLDIVRTSKLEEIKNCFDKSNVTIIHGASGQGKTALSYRYIYNNYPIGFAFQVKYFEYKDLKKIVAALKALARPLEKPFLIYIDVEPSSYEWVDLVKDIAILKNSQILVSIREEDLNRSPNIGEWITPSMLKLDFLETEAKEIFNKTENKRFLDFEEAWQTFGKKGHLLEFAYLVNKGEKLEIRLNNQIENLKNQTQDREQIKLLELVTLANSYDCRIDLHKVLKHVKLNDKKGTLQWFQNEYLFRKSEDGSWLEGLHPVRSKLLANILYDFELNDSADVFKSLIKVAKEEDLGLLLLHYFADFKDYQPIIDTILDYQTTSWTSYTSIFDSLMWLGIKKYVDENREPIREMKELVGKGFLFFIKPPFYQGIDLKNSFITDKIDKTILEKINKIKHEISDNQGVYCDVQYWLKKSKLPFIKKCNENDIGNLGKVLFWLRQFNIHRAIDFSEYDFDIIFEAIPSKYLADFLHGLFLYSKGTKSIWKEYKNKFIEKFRLEYNIPLIEKDIDTIKLHFVFDIKTLGKKSDENLFHEKTILLINIIRKAIPNKQKYSSQGYGNKTNLLKEQFDDSTKNISVANLPLQWNTTHYSTFYSLIEYEDRANTWSDITKQLYENRHRILDLFNAFIDAMVKYYKTSKFKFIEDYWSSYKSKWYRTVLDYNYLFPKEVVDKWGFTKDNQLKKDENESNTYLLKLYPHVKAIKEFQQSLSNFFNQSNRIILFKMLTEKYTNKQILKNKKIFEEEGYNFNFPHLSIINLLHTIQGLQAYQSAFEQYFSKYTISNLQELSVKEKTTYKEMLFMWRKFVKTPFKRNKNILTVGKREIKNVESNINRRIINVLHNSKAHKTIEDYEMIEDIDTARTWIIIYGKDFISAMNGIESISNGIRNTLIPAQLPNIKSLVLELDYPTFSIVPLVDNTTLNGVYFQIPLYKMLEKESVLCSLLTVKQFTDRELQFLEIDKGKDVLPQLQNLEQINNNIQLMAFRLNYITQMKDIYKEEEISQLLINNLVGKSIIELNKMWSETQNLLVESMEELDIENIPIEELYEHQEFIEILDNLIKPLGNFKELFETFQNVDIECDLIPFSIIEKWTMEFNSLTNLSGIVYVYWASLIFEREMI